MTNEYKGLRKTLREKYIASPYCRNGSGRDISSYENMLRLASDEQLADLMDTNDEWIPEEVSEACYRLDIEQSEDIEDYSDRLRERGETGWL